MPPFEDRVQSQLDVFRDPKVAERCIAFDEFYSQSEAEECLEGVMVQDSQKGETP